jgi:RNA-directed DNA polymerase
MEEVCERENCKQALARIKADKGSAGVDGMTVQELPVFLKRHWPEIREQLLSGAYRPQPVKRVENPKPDGRVRKLGIPTVLDRWISAGVEPRRPPIPIVPCDSDSIARNWNHVPQH